MYIGVNKVIEIEMCVAEPSSFKIEIAIEQLKRCTLPGIYQVLAELIQARDKTLTF
jgi:hypothetical protein